MKIGTKSLLFGAHNALIHTICISIAWIRLYGFPKDIRIWIAFLVHDLGYWGKPNIDSKEGKTHPELGAKLMHKWFDKPFYHNNKLYGNNRWYLFTLYHSRHYKNPLYDTISRLCIVDKYAFCICPKWLYLLLVTTTGEIKEYMNDYSKTHNNIILTKSEWYNKVYIHMLKFVNNEKENASH